MKKVLILAYKFPPMGTIGTRRWVKFSKYLAKNGYEVFVLARKYDYQDKVNWSHDVEHQNIKTIYFKTSYPMICLKNHKNIFEKVICKIFNILREKLFYKIDIADSESLNFFKKANEIITKESIENVVVTAPPHIFSYYATILKSENPHINLIVDYRDPWNYFTPYTLEKLKSFKTKEKSLQMETQVVTMANHIFCVTQDMTNNLKNLYPQCSQKISTLYNGFDEDDYKDMKRNEREEGNSITILYAGAFESGRKEAIILIAQALEEIDEDLLKNFKIILYSNINATSFLQSKYYKIINKYFEFNGFISQKEVIEKINECDVCLSINSADNVHAFGTKIFDYMALGKSIWHISNGGELYELLHNNNQIVSNYEIKSTIKAIESILKNKNLNNESQLNYNEFSINNQTKILEEFFK